MLSDAEKVVIFEAWLREEFDDLQWFWDERERIEDGYYDGDREEAECYLKLERYKDLMELRNRLRGITPDPEPEPTDLRDEPQP